MKICCNHDCAQGRTCPRRNKTSSGLVTGNTGETVDTRAPVRRLRPLQAHRPPRPIASTRRSVGRHEALLWAGLFTAAALFIATRL